MSSGRSRRRAGSHSKSRQSNPAGPPQHGIPPTGRPSTVVRSSIPAPLVLWGGAILIILVLAFLGILFFGPKPSVPIDPAPTPGIAPTTSPTSTVPTGMATVVTTPGATATTITSTSAGRIAFVRSSPEGGLRNLFIVNADGTNQQQVTDSINVEGTIAWSPDGNSIIMQAGIEGVSRVVRVTIGPDNKLVDSAQLTADIAADSAFPAWSPDGTRIAFQSKQDSPLFQVFLMNADGSNKRRLSDGNGFAGQPVWSPDGKMVAYVAGEQQVAGANRELYTVTVDTETPTPTMITDIGGSLSSPVWSPDGKSIACIQIISEREYKLLIMNMDGSNLRTLDEGLIIRTPAFSPAGEAILYYTISSVGNDVNLYDLTADRTSSVTKNQGDNYNPSWSPDGRMITWSSTPGNTPHKIVVANRDGTDRRTVSTGDGDDSQPVWGLPK